MRALVAARYPSGGRLYLAGAVSSTTGRSSAWFAYPDLATLAVTPLTHRHGYPSNVSAVLSVIRDSNGSLFAGRVISATMATPFSIDSVQGLLYLYDPTTATLHHDSRLLLVPSAGVFGLVPWESTLGLSLSRYQISPSSTNVTGGNFSLSPSGTILLNRSNLLPNGFVTFVAMETSSSPEWFFSGGYTTVTTTAQVVGLRL